jgi:cardiolipin synthase
VRVTANQVTLLRLFLLPLPVYMVYKAVLYGGGLYWAAAGLGLFTLVGLTDALDGMLARRHGSTPLGALLDPVVDKIFLVATFGPLADLKIVSPMLVGVLFIRELAITALRSTALEENVQFRTSRIAKLKTVVQMAGSGYIFILFFLQDRPELGPVLIVSAIGGAVPLLINLMRGRKPGWMSWSALVLVWAVCGLRLMFGPEDSVRVIMLLIIAFTLYSGGEYFWSMRTVLWRSFGRNPREVVRLGGLALAVPVCLLPVMMLDGAPIYAILTVLALELAAGGVDNSLAQAGLRTPALPDLVRSAVQIAGGAGLAWILRSPGSWPGQDLFWIHGIGVFLVLFSSVELWRRIRGKGHVFMTGLG